MATSPAKYVIPFALGVAAGVALHRNWPQIEKLAGPTGKKLIKSATDLVEQGRGKFWEKSEAFSDLVAEIREEEEAAGQGGAPPKPS